MWQIRTGKARKKQWSDRWEDLAAKLEFSFVNKIDFFTHEWDEWTQYCEMSTLTQTRPGEETNERKLRRVFRSDRGEVEDVD